MNYSRTGTDDRIPWSVFLIFLRLSAGSLPAASAPPRLNCCRAVGGLQALQLEQPRCICTGGHLIEPNEQNTQQSPAFGRSTVLHCSHS